MRPSITLEIQGFKAILAAAPLSSLLPHEETLEKEIQILSNKIVNESMQRDPIIVDRSSNTILDGMHRHLSLQRLGAKLCVACFVDYNDKRIRVSRWLRALSNGSNGLAKCKEMAQVLGMSSSMESAKAIKLTDERKLAASLISGNRAFVFSLSSDDYKKFGDDYPKDLVRKFDAEIKDRAKAEGFEVRIVSDTDSNRLLKEKVCFLYPRPPSKMEIINSAKSRDLFPAKSTRHEIPFRPVGVNFPLRVLLEDDETKASSMLKRTLQKKKMTLLNPGSSFHGRTYSETLVSYEEIT